MTEKCIANIKAVLDNLGLDISPALFLANCKMADYSPDIALEAIAEFVIRLELPREKVPQAWNEFMSGTEHMVNTLSEWNVLDEKTILDFLEKDLIWLVSLKVIRKGNPRNLIKIRL